MSKTDITTVATIDEALAKTGFGKFNYLLIIFSGCILKNVVLESVGISFALPVLECDFKLTHKQQGLLGAVSFIGIIVSSHLWGFLADTTGRKRIMRPALLSGFVVTFISAFSPNFETFAVSRFLSGVFLSAGSATVFAYLGEFHCQKYRSRAILSAAFISAFLSIFFPLIAWVFINQSWQFHVPYLDIVFKPWRSYIIACGTMGLICGLMLFYLPESPKYLMTRCRTDEAIAVMKHIHRINFKGKCKITDSTFNITTLIPDFDTPISPATVPIKNAAAALFTSMWNQTAPLFMREHIRKTFLTSLIQFINFFTAHGVYMWFPYILNSAMQYTKRSEQPMCLCDILKVTQSSNFTLLDHNTNDEIGTCATHLEVSTYHHTIILEVIYVGLLLCVSYAVGKFGRIPILCEFKLVTEPYIAVKDSWHLFRIVTILLICGTCGIIGLIIRIPLVAIYFFVIYLCCGLGITVMNAIVVDIFPTNLRAMAVCISLMLGRIGSVIGSNMVGSLIATNCEAALYCSSASLIVAGMLGFLLPKSNQTQPQKTVP